LAVDQGGETAWAFTDQLGSVTTWGTHDGSAWMLQHQSYDAFSIRFLDRYGRSAGVCTYKVDREAAHNAAIDLMAYLHRSPLLHIMLEVIAIDSGEFRTIH
jgi:hypothetical protein